MMCIYIYIYTYVCVYIKIDIYIYIYVWYIFYSKCVMYTHMNTSYVTYIQMSFSLSLFRPAWAKISPFWRSIHHHAFVPLSESAQSFHFFDKGFQFWYHFITYNIILSFHVYAYTFTIWEYTYITLNFCMKLHPGQKETHTQRKRKLAPSRSSLQNTYWGSKPPGHPGVASAVRWIS